MQNRYFFLHRLVHWAIAILVLGLLAVGVAFWALDHDNIQKFFGETFTNALYGYHQAFGIVVLGLALVAILFRVLFGTPPYNPPLGFLWRLPSRWVHVLLYIGIVTMPIVGWLGTNAAGRQVHVFQYTLPTLLGEDKVLAEQIFWLHGVLGWTLLGLVVLHFLAAKLHSKLLRDGVMERMRLF